MLFSDKRLGYGVPQEQDKLLILNSKFGLESIGPLAS